MNEDGTAYHVDMYVLFLWDVMLKLKRMYFLFVHI